MVKVQTGFFDMIIYNWVAHGEFSSLPAQFTHYLVDRQCFMTHLLSIAGVVVVVVPCLNPLYLHFGHSAFLCYSWDAFAVLGLQHHNLMGLLHPVVCTKHEKCPDTKKLGLDSEQLFSLTEQLFLWAPLLSSLVSCWPPVSVQPCASTSVVIFPLLAGAVDCLGLDSQK